MESTQDAKFYKFEMDLGNEERGPSFVARFTCRTPGCNAINVIENGCGMDACDECRNCPLGSGCLGWGHDPLILPVQPYYWGVNTGQLLNRTIRRLVDGDECPYKEMLDFQEQVTAAINKDERMRWEQDTSEDDVESEDTSKDKDEKMDE